MSVAQQSARRGGRAARRALRRDTTTFASPVPNITRRIPLTELCSEEGMEIIEANAETVLQEVGIDFKDDEEVQAMWREAGADVDGDRVRFPKGLIRSLLRTAPATYVQHARNPERNVTIGGDNVVFAPVYGPPFVSDLDNGRRYGTIKDFQNLVKLAYLAPHIHHSGGTVCEPVDIPVNKRHLDMVHAHMKFSDKPFMGAVTADERAADTIKMSEILFGREFVSENTVCTSLINVNSPLAFDATMLGSLKTYARARQAVIITPFIMSGAMGPVSAVGTLIQAMAEAMAGIALTQLCRPGTPVVFGLFSSALSMQTGAPTFGTPEPNLVLSAAAQLARRMKVPFRSGGNLCGSKLPDAQAAYESANSLMPAVLCGVNFVLHGAGWMEGGLVSSFEKFVMDCDQLGMAATLLKGYDFTEDGQALDAIREVGPSGHYLGCAHTQSHFESAFYRSTLADNNAFEHWEAAGSQDMAERANGLWKEWLASYEQPPLDPAIDEALQAFIDKRKEAMVDKWS